MNLVLCYFVVQGAKWIKCRALFALDKMGVARCEDIAVRVGLTIAVRVGLTEQVSTRQRRDRGDCSYFLVIFVVQGNGCKNRFLCS